MRLLSTILLAAAALVVTPAVRAQLGPPPEPTENPVTEAKRVLGKILFWDEQLSSDDTVACGTCHQPLAGGADPRIGVNPGVDLIFHTPDDVNGSPGVARVDAGGNRIDDPLYGFEPRVTRRAANTAIGAAYSPELFFDGRAGTTFIDPESGTQSIAGGGALENQAVGPILNDVEMAYEGRTWSDVKSKLAGALPLRDATDYPADVAAALTVSPDYPSLFIDAFGDPAITAERIAYAIATYERTLVSDQTPWDLFVAGNPGAMTPDQAAGWNFFLISPCSVCHTPPAFTDHTYRNIGIRPPGEDDGRMEVTRLESDRGRFKTPTLRNVGLKATGMHNGRLLSVEESVLWYDPNNAEINLDNLDPLLPVPIPPPLVSQVVDFVENALTDPRVEAETFPFDRPTLHGGDATGFAFQADEATMTWAPLAGVQRYNVYRGIVTDLTDVGGDGLPAAGYGSCISAGDPDPTDTFLVDATVPASGEFFFYVKSVVDSTGTERCLGATGDGKARAVLNSCP